MNRTWKRDEFGGSLESRSLDRLVDGSLPEAERRKLLLQLESEPEGWRRCALAFLEAQTWREAFAPLAAAASAAAPANLAIRTGSPPPHWRRAVRWVALAACILAGFALGWASRPPESSVRELAQVNQAPHVEPSAPPGSANVEPDAEAVAKDREPSNPAIEKVVQAWQRQGYSAERQNSVVTVKLRDGSELALPAQEIKLRYTGDRTY
jgi:hypothetical protein